jgi:hypothetical protein
VVVVLVVVKILAEEIVIDQPCTRPFVMNVEIIAKYLLDHLLVDQYFARTVLKNKMVVVDQINSVGVERDASDLAMRIDKCTVVFAQLVEKTAKYLSDLQLANQFFAMTVLAKKAKEIRVPKKLWSK